MFNSALSDFRVRDGQRSPHPVHPPTHLDRSRAPVCKCPVRAELALYGFGSLGMGPGKAQTQLKYNSPKQCRFTVYFIFEIAFSSPLAYISLFPLSSFLSLSSLSPLLKSFVIPSGHPTVTVAPAPSSRHLSRSLSTSHCRPKLSLFESSLSLSLLARHPNGGTHPRWRLLSPLPMPMRGWGWRPTFRGCR